jgi:hypothetical protein
MAKLPGLAQIFNRKNLLDLFNENSKYNIGI